MAVQVAKTGAPTNLPTVGRDQWHASVLGSFCAMDIHYDRSEDFRGELLDTTLNRLHMARIGSSGVDVQRQRHHIGHNDQAHYLVKFQLTGTGLVEQRGHRALLNPGDFVLCSSIEPYRLRFDAQYQQAVIAIPQPLMLEMYRSVDDILGVRMGYESATNSLLSQFVSSVMSRVDQLDPHIIARLEANILDLLVTSLHGSNPSTMQTPNIGRSSSGHLASVKRLIALNLTNSGLTTDFIAEAEGISKRYLHLLFKSEETSLSRYIQRQRLEACRSALTDPSSNQLSTTDIALQWGFSDVSHFCRCFKAAYGVTPRQYKLKAQN